MTINLPKRILDELRGLRDKKDPELKKLLKKFKLKMSDLKENKEIEQSV